MKLVKSLSLAVIFILLSTLVISCGGEKEEPGVGEGGQVENSPTKDADIQRYNLERKKELSENRSPCDTLSVIEYVLNNYPAGTYLVDFDKTLTRDFILHGDKEGTYSKTHSDNSLVFNEPQPAVIYYKDGGETYIFCVIARSKPGERLIEVKNIVGYDQSYIDFDSTKLGTAFFYLALLKCEGDNSFQSIWEAPIPSHGGFNKITLERWNNTQFIRVNFHYAQGVGHIDYNYFMMDGFTSFPHLMMTYKGLNFQRTFLNFNNDKFPDYYEWLYVDTGDRVYPVDSVAFYWNAKDSVYVNSRNKKQTRPY